jgi:hypothetical protein
MLNEGYSSLAYVCEPDAGGEMRSRVKMPVPLPGSMMLRPDVVAVEGREEWM